MRSFEKIGERVEDDDARVRFQVALSLGESDRPDAAMLLAMGLAVQDGHDPWFARAILSSAKDRAGYILRVLVDDTGFVNQGSAGRVDLIKQLATVVGARGDVDELAGVFAALTKDEADGSWWRQQRPVDWDKDCLVTGVNSDAQVCRSCWQVRLRRWPSRLSESNLCLTRISKLPWTGSVRLPIVSRRSSCWRINRSPGRRIRWQSCCRPSNRAAVQAATIDALSANGSVDAAKIVLDAWSGLAPTVRGSAVAMLLRRVDSTKLALDAMLAHKVSPAVISIDQRVRLLKHSDPEILAKAKKLLGGAVSSNRQQVASQYRKALDLKATASAGQQVFKRVCANCHRINGDGHTTGPDLSDTRNRSKLALLYDILDPNAKVEPRFVVCTVLTDDGNVFSGLIGSENADAIVLNMAEGKQQTINRNRIDEIRVGDVSLMPEGVEKDISVQQMADLLEFLRPGG